MSFNHAPIQLESNPFDWTDPLLLDLELTSEERMVRESAREFCAGQLMPRVRDGFRNETFDPVFLVSRCRKPMAAAV